MLPYHKGFAAAERILPIIDIDNEINLNENGEKLNVSKGDIFFENVNFSYKSNQSNKVLQNITTKFVGGKMTALVGHSGSGQINIIKYDPKNLYPN
jgi:subfamily B ATP-binding cassette protein MsbA